MPWPRRSGPSSRSWAPSSCSWGSPTSSPPVDTTGRTTRPRGGTSTSTATGRTSRRPHDGADPAEVGRHDRLYHLGSCPHGVVVSTSPFHGGSGSSTLPGGIYETLRVSPPSTSRLVPVM